MIERLDRLSPIPHNTGSPATREPENDSESFLYPCTTVQRTCWFLEEISPGTPKHNIAVRVRLEGDLRPTLLEEALRSIIRRHEILRTRIVLDHGEPYQLVEDEVRFSLPVTDLRSHADPARTREAERISAEEARLVFDLQNGPLFRARLLQLADLDYTLLLTMHHMISDGWSIGIVTEELGALYEALASNLPSSLPDLPIQYVDYACWQQEWFASGEIERHLGYWKNTLDGFVPLRIATDFDRPANQGDHGEIRSLVIPRALTSAVKEVGDKEGCTLFMVMFAAFLVLMERESGQTDIVIRTQTAGRNKVEFEPLIGWFVNSILLRGDLSGDPSFLELLKRIQESVLEAFAHQDVPFERVIEVARPNNTSPRHPPFQVNFIFQRDFVKPWTRAGITMTPIPSKSAGTFVDLNFFLVEREDGWRASVDVNTDVFRPSTAELFLQSFQKLLENVAADPSAPISRIAPPRAVRNKIQSSASPEAAPEKTVAVSGSPLALLEEQLIRIWEEILGTRVDSSTNFFDAGGHSLLAVQMLSKVRQCFGREINLADLLFADPTVAAMARMLEASGVTGLAHNIVPVQPNGDRPPFFMIGGDHWFRPLAVHTGMDQPFLGVPLTQYKHLDPEKHRLQIAAEVGQMLLDNHGGQTFFLGGWCSDGVTAFEVARFISERGGRIGLLVLFDATNPDYSRSLRSVAHSTGRAAKSLRSILTGGIKGSFFHSARVTLHQIGEVMSKALGRILYLFRSEYSCPEVSFPILVLRPPSSGIEDPELGWRKVCPFKLAVVEVPGAHDTIFKEPNVRNLGQALRRHLDLQMSVAAEKA